MFFNYFGRNTAYNTVGRNILSNKGTDTYNCAVANSNSLHNNCFVAYPNIVAYNNIALIIPSRGYICHIKTPFFKENREIVCGKGVKGMFAPVNINFALQAIKQNLPIISLSLFIG